MQSSSTPGHCFSFSRAKASARQDNHQKKKLIVVTVIIVMRSRKTLPNRKTTNHAIMVTITELILIRNGCARLYMCSNHKRFISHKGLFKGCVKRYFGLIKRFERVVEKSYRALQAFARAL